MGDSAPKTKIIPVEAILREPFNFNQVIDRDWLLEQIRERNLAFTPAGPFSLTGVLFSSGQEIFLQGQMGAEFFLPCGRCLEEYPLRMSGPLQVHWRIIGASGTRSGGKPDQGIHLEDVDTGAIQETGVDLYDTLLEQVILNLPMRPLCRDSCQGLCPVCGENRNIHPCPCGEKKKNNPFEGLKKIQLS